MKKIVLRAAPKGRILSNNELKSILGGVGVTTQDCKCTLQLSNGVFIDEEVDGSADSGVKECREACAAACSGYTKYVSSDPQTTPTKLTCSGFTIDFHITSDGHT